MVVDQTDVYLPHPRRVVAVIVDEPVRNLADGGYAHNDSDLWLFAGGPLSPVEQLIDGGGP